MRKVTFVVAAVLLWTAKPAEATFLYEYSWHSGSQDVGFSFSFTRDEITQSSLVFNDPFTGSISGPLLTLQEPTNCNITQVVFAAQFLLNENEIGVYGFCFNPLSAFVNEDHFHQRFDHLGTYTGTKGGVLTISEVPDLGSTAMMFALGIAALGLRRRIRNPLHH